MWSGLAYSTHYCMWKSFIINLGTVCENVFVIPQEYVSTSKALAGHRYMYMYEWTIMYMCISV